MTGIKATETPVGRMSEKARLAARDGVRAARLAANTQCFRCGRPVHVERLEPNRTFTTDPDGTPHTCQRDEDA